MTSSIQSKCGSLYHHNGEIHWKTAMQNDAKDDLNDNV